MVTLLFGFCSPFAATVASNMQSDHLNGLYNIKLDSRS